MGLRDDKFLSVKEVAKAFGISTKTVYRLAESGQLAGHKIGSIWRFTEEDVETYLERTRNIGKTKYPGRVFHPVVLTKYHHAPHKYQIIQRGLYWWLSFRDDYLARLSEGQRARQNFKAVKFRKVMMPKHGQAILVSSRFFDRLPEEDQIEWLKFEIKPQ